MSSRNKTRFRLHVPERPREFGGVEELCEQWPLTVEALRDHEPPLRPTHAVRQPVDFVKVSFIAITTSTDNDNSKLLLPKVTWEERVALALLRNTVPIGYNATP